MGDSDRGAKGRQTRIGGRGICRVLGVLNTNFHELITNLRIDEYEKKLSERCSTALPCYTFQKEKKSSLEEEKRLKPEKDIRVPGWLFITCPVGVARGD